MRDIHKWCTTAAIWGVAGGMLLMSCMTSASNSAIEADTTRFEECANLYAAADTIEELRAAQAKCHVTTDGGAP